MNGPTDTSPEVRAVELSALRRLGPSGRARLVADLTRRARELTEQGVRLRHPDWPPDRVAWEVVRLTLGFSPFSQPHDDA